MVGVVVVGGDWRSGVVVVVSVCLSLCVWWRWEDENEKVHVECRR